MDEQEKYYPVVIKSLRDATPTEHHLAHEAIIITERYCKAPPETKHILKAAAVEAVNALKSNSTSLRLGYYFALLWLLADTAIGYDTIRYNLKDYYKLPWDVQMEDRCTLWGADKSDWKLSAQHRMERALKDDDYDITLTLVGELMLETYAALHRISERLSNGR